ncbi:MAG: hypothetical protein IJG43_06535 [Acidaminococcaceae bacterium]|jgi:hypothetical protein|nr:hypothetical protein [Acidaminococcaceae bacterium]
MKKLFVFLAVIVALCCGIAGDISALDTVPFLGMPKAHAFETKPVNFVVIDRTGSVNRADMRGWIQMVKMDYHVPYYRLMDDNTKANAAVDEMFAKNPKPDKEAMKAAAEQAGCGALVVMVVHRMDSYLVRSFGPFDDETYVRTHAFADMYAYNSDGNKFIRRFLRETDLKPLGLEENPSDTIKWTLGNLLNKMEGKPQI